METMEQIVQPIELVGRQKLLLERSPSENKLKIIGEDGQVRLSISVTPEGPVLHFEGCGLIIRSEGDLEIDAKKVAFHGRDGMSITTGGDVEIEAEGDLRSSARIQEITAVRGNVNVRANDDVKLDGERIKLNCD